MTSPNPPQATTSSQNSHGAPQSRAPGPSPPPLDSVNPVNPKDPPTDGGSCGTPQASNKTEKEKQLSDFLNLLHHAIERKDALFDKMCAEQERALSMNLMRTGWMQVLEEEWLVAFEEVEGLELQKRELEVEEEEKDGEVGGGGER